MYHLCAAGTVTVHAVAVVDGVLLYIAVRYTIVTGGNVVVLRGSTWRYMTKVGVGRVH